MKSSMRFLGLLLVLAFFLSSNINALQPIEGGIFGIYPIVNEVSFYKNAEDDLDDRGWTLQVISINKFDLLTNFNLEFTGDFNWEMSDMDHDYYIELSFVKPLTPAISFNYQRIISTFEDRDINQVGLRLSL